MIEFINSKNHKPVFRDRELQILPPVGAFIRFSGSKVWVVEGHMFDYDTNGGNLWICVIVREKE